MRDPPGRETFKGRRSPPAVMPDITACSNCGSQRLRYATGGEGRAFFALEESERYCRDCQTKGPPLLFDDLHAWKAFYDDRQAHLEVLEEGWEPLDEDGRKG